MSCVEQDSVYLSVDHQHSNKHTFIKYHNDIKHFQLISRRACTGSTLRWPTTGTGLTQQLTRTEEENFAIRGNLAVIYNY